MRLNKAQREMVRSRFGGRCAYCGIPLNDRFHIDHLMPSCPPCNIDKHAMPLEAWRAKLQRSTEVLARNNPTYRHALRFAQVCETRRPVVFYFEQVRV